MKRIKSKKVKVPKPMKELKLLKDKDKFELDKETGKAAKKVISRKFKSPKPQSLTESMDESSLAEGDGAKLAPPTAEDVKKIKLSKKVKRKKKKGKK